MLHAAAAVVVEVLLDLRRLDAHGGLVDRERHHAARVAGDLAAQRAVLGGDVVLVELLEDVEAEDLRVEGHPVVHLAELDVADGVVDEAQADAAAAASLLAIAGPVSAGVLVALDEVVHGVAEGGDRCEGDRAVGVGDGGGLADAAGAA